MTIGLQFGVDGLGIVMLLLVVVVGAAVGAHVLAYLRDPATRRRVSCQLLLFAVAMSVLVTADDLLLMYLAWEATSVLSFLLIGTKDSDSGAREAARRALATTGAGGLALLVGLVLIIQSTGEQTVSGVLATGVDGPTATAAAVLILAGALAKAAQPPFQGWLPGAMAAPAPVSAYLHSATMVKAGVFLIARLSPAFADVATWELLVLSAATAGVLVGGVRAVVADDLKALFAWSTVSQLGLLIVLLSSGDPKVLLAGTGLMVAHAVAKAALFLSVGTIEKGTGTRSLAELAGLGRRRRVIGATVTIGLLSLAGLPPTYGFVSKEGALVGLLDAGDDVRLAVLLIGSVLTAIYATKVITTLWSPVPHDSPDITPVSAVMDAAPAGLAGLALGLGVIWPLGDQVAALGATAIAEKAGEKHLVLWAGPNLALGLSLMTIGLGIAVAFGLARLGVASRPIGRPDVVGGVLDLPVHAGRMAVRLVRPGVLRPTVAVVLIGFAMAVLIPTASRLGGLPDAIAGLPASAGPLATLPLIVVMASALGAALIRERFAAVLALGMVGFAMSGWFVVNGAPDLALTQALVETVVVLAFLLVLRRLPTRREPAEGPARGTARWVPRLLVAVGAGLSAGALALAVATTERLTPVAEELLARSYTDGKGRNPVNVILTDVRALDTFGEVAVIAVAALGAARLFGATRRSMRASSGGEG